MRFDYYIYGLSVAIFGFFGSLFLAGVPETRPITYHVLAGSLMVGAGLIATSFFVKQREINHDK